MPNVSTPVLLRTSNGLAAIRQVFPHVKLVQTFRFGTNENGKKGQQFWFDDFRILTEERYQ